VEELLLDRAQLLTLTAPEMTVLIGGMRTLNTNFGHSKHGVFTKRPETLTNDFFVKPARHETKWQPRIRRRLRRTRSSDARTQMDLHPYRPHFRFRTRSSERLRKSMDVRNAKEAFVREFVSVWNKVMNLDRYDLAAAERDLPLDQSYESECVPVGYAHLPLDTSDPPRSSNCHPERSRGIWVASTLPDSPITQLPDCFVALQLPNCSITKLPIRHSLPPPPTVI